MKCYHLFAYLYIKAKLTQFWAFDVTNQDKNFAGLLEIQTDLLEISGRLASISDRAVSIWKMIQSDAI